ncbi:MAG TPA: archease [Candidatus Acidoferrales bacterium]|nr:archease [Candidatus Acidoferrales bacterium]
MVKQEKQEKLAKAANENEKDKALQKADKFAGKFEFLEHTADIYVRAFGEKMWDAYENAALAMFETMTDTGKVAQTVEESFEVEAEDQYALLYNWLEMLLVKAETQGMMYSKFTVENWRESPDGFKFEAKIFGEKFDPKKHPQKVGVKAVTYHLMMVIKETDKVILEFILDI